MTKKRMINFVLIITVSLQLQRTAPAKGMRYRFMINEETFHRFQVKAKILQIQ